MQHTSLGVVQKAKFCVQLDDAFCRVVQVGFWHVESAAQTELALSHEVPGGPLGTSTLLHAVSGSWLTVASQLV